VPVIELHTITADSRFEVKGIEITPIEGRHSEHFKVFGYRIGKLAYLTDFDAISDTELSKLEGVECLVINALRWTTHSSHFSVGQALDIIKRVRPKRALLTHMSHEIGRHAEADALLSDGVQFAYDGLTVEIE
jgi:phosphoribosyl 1,2-cyclic phosphate phosphodiesterase